MTRNHETSLVRTLVTFGVIGILSLANVCPGSASAQDKCLTGEGDAAIVNNDITSAKREATARARWNAL